MQPVFQQQQAAPLTSNQQQFLKQQAYQQGHQQAFQLGTRGITIAYYDDLLQVDTLQYWNPG